MEDILNKENVTIGMGVHECMYTDVISHTVVAISPTKKTITLQRDKVTLLTDPVIIAGGFVGHCVEQPKYLIERDKEGTISKAYWSDKFNCYRVSCNHIYMGRRYYYDYNF